MAGHRNVTDTVASRWGAARFYRSRGRRALSPPEGIVPKKVTPALGALKRYAATDCATYASVEATAKKVYDYMLRVTREGGPKFARVKELWPKARGQITNKEWFHSGAHRDGVPSSSTPTGDSSCPRGGWLAMTRRREKLQDSDVNLRGQSRRSRPLASLQEFRQIAEGLG